MKLKNLVFMVLFIVLGVLTRTVFHVAPNVEFVTALALAAGYFIQKKYSLAVPFGIMVISDLIIGNTSIYLFTWSAYGLAWLVGIATKNINLKEVNLPKYLKHVVIGEAAGIVFTGLFFLWTNFGVVIVTNMYPKNLGGLVSSYTMGLPFLVPQLVGNMIVVPAVFVLTDLAYNSKLALQIKGKLMAR